MIPSGPSFYDIAGEWCGVCSTTRPDIPYVSPWWQLQLVHPLMLGGGLSLSLSLSAATRN